MSRERILNFKFIELFYSLIIIKYKMFENVKNETTKERYIKAIDFLRRNMKGVEYTGDNKFFITEFDAVIKFLSDFSDLSVHRYAVIIRLLIPSINDVSEEEKELAIKKYLFVMKQVYKKKRVVQPSHIDEKLRKINRTRIKGSRFAEKTYLEKKHEFEEAVEKAKQIAQVLNTEITENVHDQILSYTKLINLNEVTVNGYEKKMIQLFRDYLPDSEQ